MSGLIADLIEFNFRSWTREIDRLANDPARRHRYERAVQEIALAREKFDQAWREKARNVKI